MYRYTASPLLPLGLTFGVNGAAYASTLPRLPQIAADLDLGPAELGLVLVSASIGGLVGSVSAPAVLRRAGSGPLTALAGLALLGALLALGAAPTALAFAAALVAYGVLDGLHDTAMNDLAADVQAQRGRSVMGRMHAGWSAAGVVGAGAGAGMAALGVPVLLHLALAAGALALVQVWAGARLRPLRSTHEPVAAPGGSAARRTAVRSAGVLAVAAVAAALLEGPAMDWSALQLSRDLDAAPGTAGLAPTLFLAGMLLGRLVTDPVVDALGAVRTARLAALCTGTAVVLGLAGAAATGAPAVALAGWALAGVGVAPVFPLLFTAAGGGGAAGLVSGTSRLGFLTAPLLVGGVAGATSVSTALLVMPVAALVLAVALPARLRRTGAPVEAPVAVAA